MVKEDAFVQAWAASAAAAQPWQQPRRSFLAIYVTLEKCPSLTLHMGSASLEVVLIVHWQGRSLMGLKRKLMMQEGETFTATAQPRQPR